MESLFKTIWIRRSSTMGYGSSIITVTKVGNHQFSNPNSILSLLRDIEQWRSGHPHNPHIVEWARILGLPKPDFADEHKYSPMRY
ncbi:hypothetical protein TNCV_4428911 [Trichonephila clavipes]|nr:hypothetical protein TNCV_4428911 [Trichonephila clavipes]